MKQSNLLMFMANVKKIIMRMYDFQEQ